MIVCVCVCGCTGGEGLLYVVYNNNIIIVTVMHNNYYYYNYKIIRESEKWTISQLTNPMIPIAL